MGTSAIINLISTQSIVKAASDQVSSDLSGEVVILDLKSGVYYGLDTVGARVWQFIQEPLTVSEILSALLDEYDVEPSRCERDLLALLEQLSHRGLIEISDETSI